MLQLIDVNPVLLDCHVVDGALVLSHRGTPVGSDGLKIKLFDLAQTMVVINDFEHDGVRHRVNAFTQASDASLTPWERTAGGARLSVLRPASGPEIAIDVTVMATTYAPSGEVTARELTAFAQQSLYTPAAVKVRLPSPEDSRPGG
jgi:hypothetical protein